jgi:hypothetical protein
MAIKNKIDYKDLTITKSFIKKEDIPMKKIILSILIIMNSLSFASITEGKIDNIFCGEWDPYFIGDACILFVEEAQNTKTIIIYDIDEFTYFLEDMNIENFEELNGKNISFDKNNYQSVKDRDLLYEFKSHDKNSLLSTDQKVDLKITEK